MSEGLLGKGIEFDVLYMSGIAAGFIAFLVLYRAIAHRPSVYGDTFLDNLDLHRGMLDEVAGDRGLNDRD
jgi:hypothetical protein